MPSSTTDAPSNLDEGDNRVAHDRLGRIMTETSPRPSRWKQYLAGGALLATGIAGGSMVGNAFANADTVPGTATAASSTATTDATAQSTSQRSDETLLTGADADKVTAAALAQYPGATIDRVETDSDGVYEAHVTTTDGQKLTVQVGADFTVTGTETHGDH